MSDFVPPDGAFPMHRTRIRGNIYGRWENGPAPKSNLSSMIEAEEAWFMRVPEPSAQDGEHLIHGDVEESIMSRFAVFKSMEPEEDETWESWYEAALDMLQDEVREIFRLTRQAASARSGVDQ